MKNIEYFSTDKLYKIKGHKITRKNILTISAVITILLLIISIVCFKQSVRFSSEDGFINYAETGNIDYKIYLKDNNYYDTSYLEKGMQYVASLIKTINVKFDYQIHSEEELDAETKYKVVSELQITERDTPSKVLYTKTNDLISEKTLTVTDDAILINE